MKVGDLRQLVFSPEMSSHCRSLRVLLSVHCFPQLPTNTADRNTNTPDMSQAGGNQSNVPAAAQVTGVHFMGFLSCFDRRGAAASSPTRKVSVLTARRIQSKVCFLFCFYLTSLLNFWMTQHEQYAFRPVLFFVFCFF